MVALVRLARVLLIVALACLVISLVMALGTSNTGLLEKVVLLGLICGGVYAAAMVTTLSERIVHRLQR